MVRIFPKRFHSTHGENLMSINLRASTANTTSSLLVLMGWKEERVRIRISSVGRMSGNERQRFFTG